MSIQSVHSNSIAPYSEHQRNLEMQLVEAMGKVDIESIKDLVSQGANPNQKIMLNTGQILKMFNSIKDDSLHELLLQFICKIGAKLQDDEIPTTIIDALSKGPKFSDDFYSSLNLVAKEVTDFIDSFIGPQNELSLFSMAVALRDLDLIQLLIESKVDVKNSISEDGNFFDAGLTSQKSIDILNYMLNQGYSLESLLGSEETFEEIIENAQDIGDELLLSFLKEHGILLDENIEMESFAEKV